MLKGCCMLTLLVGYCAFGFCSGFYQWFLPWSSWLWSLAAIIRSCTMSLVHLNFFLDQCGYLCRWVSLLYLYAQYVGLWYLHTMPDVTLNWERRLQVQIRLFFVFVDEYFVDNSGGGVPYSLPEKQILFAGVWFHGFTAVYSVFSTIKQFLL